MARIMLIADPSEAVAQLRKAIIGAGHQVTGLPPAFSGVSSAEPDPPDLVVVERLARERGDKRIRRAEASARLNSVPVAIFDPATAGSIRLPKALQELTGRLSLPAPPPAPQPVPPQAPPSPAAIIGKAPAMRRVFDLIAKVAPTNATVLITGESGTGKELVAQAIHHYSLRRAARFVTQNCSAPTTTCSRASSSGTSAAPSPAPRPTSPASSTSPTAARSSSTRSAR